MLKHDKALPTMLRPQDVHPCTPTIWHTEAGVVLLFNEASETRAQGSWAPGERTVATVGTVGVKPPDVHHVVDERQRVDHHDEHLEAKRLEETREDERLCARKQRGTTWHMEQPAPKHAADNEIRETHLVKWWVGGQADICAGRTPRALRRQGPPAPGSIEPTRRRTCVPMSVSAIIFTAPAGMRCPSPSCPKPRGARIRRRNICRTAPAVRTARGPLPSPRDWRASASACRPSRSGRCACP